MCWQISDGIKMATTVVNNIIMYNIYIVPYMTCKKVTLIICRLYRISCSVTC